MRVFISREIASNGPELMMKAGLHVEQWTEKRDLSETELIVKCKNADIFVSVGPNKINKNFLQASKHLKLIALHSVGFDQVDVSEADKLGIPVTNTPGVLTKATADMAFLLIQMVARKAIFHHKRILNAAWKFFDPLANLGTDITGKTLGIFGMGNIGAELARMCVNAFDMEIIYHNRSVNKNVDKNLGARWVSFDELLVSSDIISVNASLNDDNYGIFNYDVFSAMKPSSLFINTARGGLHNEGDLIRALSEHKIGGAGLDVTHPEPMDAQNPLLSLENVVVTPHIGTSTLQTRQAMADLIARNVIAVFHGEKAITPVGKCNTGNY